MRRLPFATVLLLLVAVAGCATSSQILPVTPRPAVSAGAERGAGRTLAAELIDARPDNVVGLRDPAAPDTAITTPPEMLARIRQAIEDGFRRQGFTIVPVGEPADVVLEVRLTELGYQRDASGALKDLRTGATFEVTSIIATHTINATYRDAQTKETLFAPSREENAAILNRHVDAALAKLLDDTRLTEAP